MAYTSKILAPHLLPKNRPIEPEMQTASPAVPPPSTPSVLELFSNFTYAAARFAASGFKVVDEETFEYRLTVCRGCKLWIETARMGLGKCSHEKCGCTKFKHHLASEKCPIGKW